MRISYQASVDQPIEAVWTSLTDVDSVIAALPGAALAKAEGGVSGSLKCKLGSTQVTYRVVARAEVGAAEFHSTVLTITGTEARGSGTLEATVTVALRDGGTTTGVDLSGDVVATGRGESARESAWQKVIELNLNALLPPASPPPPPEPAPVRPPLAVAPPPPAAPARSDNQQRQLAFGLMAVALLILLRRLRRRRK